MQNKTGPSRLARVARGAAACAAPPAGIGASALLLLLAALPGVSAAQATPGEFGVCVALLQDRARADGISDAVVDGVLGEVSFVEQIIELDRRQPEFTRTFADYYNRRVTDERVTQGRALLKQHRKLLDDVQRDSGVPAHYLVAFWGLETNFGSYFGGIAVPNALATLACDPRRGDFFAGELMAALHIIDAGDISAERMIGSWAGAMGHMQFLPSVFRRYARDGDGDGRRDLWTSIPDAMASAGNFLRELGWQRGYRWGREVRLPPDFDYAQAGREPRRPLSVWVEAGVTDASGGALPPLDLPAAVIVPSGHKGPAFLAYDNFDVIMKWNRSEFYALAVGRLADRIAGGAPLTRAPADAGLRVTRDEVFELQTALQSMGYDVGKPDGLFGPSTRRALSAFQQSRDRIADGHPDAETVSMVLNAARTQ